MRLPIVCTKCFQEDGRPPDEATSVELRDDGLYTVSCRRGHETVTAIQEQKFEVLFDLGAMALLDGYPRDAISSIAASLERFLEYYVRVVSLKHGISHEAIVEAWKPMSRQSERQLGAFLLVYLIENGKSVDPLVFDSRPELEGRAKHETPTWSEFRNRVIHQGYIPSTVEALASVRPVADAGDSRALGAHAPLDGDEGYTLFQREQPEGGAYVTQARWSI